MPDAVNLTIGSYPFQCYRLADAAFINIAGVYVIIGVAEDGKWTVLDVGQSGELGERIQGHPRSESWHRNWPNGNIWVCVYPTPTNQFTKDQRTTIERSLRDSYRPLCGER